MGGTTYTGDPELHPEVPKQIFRGTLFILPWRILRSPCRSLATTTLTLRNDVQCETVILFSPAMEAVLSFAD